MNLLIMSVNKLKSLCSTFRNELIFSVSNRLLIFRHDLDKLEIRIA